MAPPIEDLITERIRELAREVIAKTLADQEPSPPEPLLDRKAAAEWARCSLRQVDHWLAEGAPCVRLGGPGGSPRMVAAELLSWLRGRAPAPRSGKTLAGGYADGMRRVSDAGGNE